MNCVVSILYMQENILIFKNICTIIKNAKLKENNTKTKAQSMTVKNYYLQKKEKKNDFASFNIGL